MKKTKVYVNIPSAAVAGGVESLFQLVDAINSQGGEGYVIWDVKRGDAVPIKYSKYKILESNIVDDSPDNWIIYPEVWTERLFEYKNIKNCIWWLSVDNNHNKFQDFGNKSITHFYQSYYALNYLENKGSINNLPLFDYISDSYLNQNESIIDKKNIICYNPVKGRENTSLIISQNPNVHFLSLTNMGENQIIESLKSSKIYIDFGHHPGRDRIPREAALLNNCVITNKKGSAGFYNDITINDFYKTEDLNDVKTKIDYCFNNFEQANSQFHLYRNIIKNQKEQLINLVKQYFL